MAKFKIQLSNGFDRVDYISDLTEEEAIFICTSRGGTYIDDAGRMWDMDYVNDGPVGRLTKWNGSKWTLPQGKDHNGNSYWRLIAERLAAYENTGLTPEEIMDLKGGAG